MKHTTEMKYRLFDEAGEASASRNLHVANAIALSNGIPLPLGMTSDMEMRPWMKGVTGYGSNIEELAKDYVFNHKKLGPEDMFSNLIDNNSGKGFFIIGDYDCDGIFATAIVATALSLVGERVSFTAPDRFADGYGMKKKHIDEAIKNNCHTIITVDNGITAKEEIEYAKSKGLTVIITDHHLLGESGWDEFSIRQKIGPCDLYVDPWVGLPKAPTYQDDVDISGATVALKLAIYFLLTDRAVIFEKSRIMDMIAMAGITCFSDVMTLRGENRMLVDIAMGYLNKTCPIEGTFANRICDMLDYYVPGKSKVPGISSPGIYRHFDKDNVDFYFIPMINAVNRVAGNVNSLIYDIISLFTNDYSGFPHVYRDMNKERKYMRTEMLRLHNRDYYSSAVVEVLHPVSIDENFSGISGLVASDICEAEGKPALIGIPCEDGMAKFSGRSVGGYDLYKAFERITKDHPEYGIKFGGHAEAIGMTCREEDAPSIQSFLSNDYDTMYKPSETTEEEATYLLTGEYAGPVMEEYANYRYFGKGFAFPEMVATGNIISCDRYCHRFSIDSLGSGIEVLCYGSSDLESISRKLASNTYLEISFTISPMFDANGKVCLKMGKMIR